MSHILHLSLSRSGYKMSHLLHRSLMGIQVWCLLQQELIHHVDSNTSDQGVLLWFRLYQVLYQVPSTRTIKVDTLRLTETYLADCY